jgi:hypothetical protein
LLTEPLFGITVLQLISSQLISFGGQSSAGPGCLLQGQNEDVDILGHQYGQLPIFISLVFKPTWLTTACHQRPAFKKRCFISLYPDPTIEKVPDPDPTLLYCKTIKKEQMFPKNVRNMGAAISETTKVF